jgi:hypothetical protein
MYDICSCMYTHIHHNTSMYSIHISYLFKTRIQNLLISGCCFILGLFLLPCAPILRLCVSMYVYVYIYIYMYVCMYVYTYIYTYIYIYIYIYTPAYIHTVSANIHISMFVSWIFMVFISYVHARQSVQMQQSATTPAIHKTVFD